MIQEALFDRPGVPASVHLAAVKALTPELLAETAAAEGVCVRPILAKVYDTVAGTEQLVTMPCGSTLASRCLPCSEKARRLRMAQCREGWHLEDEPHVASTETDATFDAGDAVAEDGQDEGSDAGEGLDEGSDERRVRSTRRRQDVADLPRVRMDARTVGAKFVGRNGRTYQPSLFLTVTLGSYGRVHRDGTPVNPDRYDYRRAALDAMHFSKVIDRLMQNLRRCAGFKVQYFAAIEPQRRLAPHLHAALRGVLPRAIVRQVVAATYHQLWWPSFDEVVFDDDHLPVWDERLGCYVNGETGEVLPTWQQSLDRLDAQLELDPATRPAHVVRLGSQVDIQGIISTSGQADRRVGYLTKYLGKSMSDPMGETGDLTPRQRRHFERLHEQVRHLPCTPKCANWLRYGLQPKDAGPGMLPGACQNKAHDREHLGCGGRRVLVSRQWTGKSLTEHRADRAEVVRQVLALAGIEVDQHDQMSAAVLTEHGVPRYEWKITRPGGADLPTYRSVISSSISHAMTWRKQYEEAKARAGPLLAHVSATEVRRVPAPA